MNTQQSTAPIRFYMNPIRAGMKALGFAIAQIVVGTVLAALFLVFIGGGVVVLVVAFALAIAVIVRQILRLISISLSEKRYAESGVLHGQLEMLREVWRHCNMLSTLETTAIPDGRSVLMPWHWPKGGTRSFVIDQGNGTKTHIVLKSDCAYAYDVGADQPLAIGTYPSRFITGDEIDLLHAGYGL